MHVFVKLTFEFQTVLPVCVCTEQVGHSESFFC